MPMKGSDDYLTAKGANPRTGLISPSLVTTPLTPASPAHALQIRRTRESPSRSPLADPSSLALNQQPNEGRKVQGLRCLGKNNASSWRQFLLSSDNNTVPSAAGRQNPGTVMPSHDTMADDSFVVKMPSAHEPQPYSFPGSTTSEIQAFTHYKQKTRRTSGQGYDRRLFSSGEHQMPSSFHDTTAVHSAGRGVSGSSQTQDTQSSPQPNVHTKTERIARKPVPEPEIPANEPSPKHAARRASTEEPLPVPISSTASQPNKVNHLNQLPRVKLIHPSLAALPADMPPSIPSKRVCSLGCKDHACSQQSRRNKEPDLLSQKSESGQFEKRTDDTSVDLVHVMAQIYQLMLISVSLIWLSLSKLSLVTRMSEDLKRYCSMSLTIWDVYYGAKWTFTRFVQFIALLLMLGLAWIVVDITQKTMQLIFWPIDMMIRVARWSNKHT